MRRPVFDPQQLPVMPSEASLPALGAERLTAEFVRDRLRTPPDWEPEHTDESRLIDASLKLREAAVLVPLVQRDAGLTVLLTQRNASLSQHAGQISFPGGGREAIDRDAVDTALRETNEEVGIEGDHIEVVGRLPDYITGTGFHVSPVVGLLTPDFVLRPDPSEVAEVFEVPLAFLMDPANHEVRELRWEDRVRRFYAMPYRRPDGAYHFIWGATAGMLRNLYHLLAA
ncbi:CoA pyrophosphatase [Ralstonia mannitolilytica]|jgi:8-oxo-dGTP pyrophosphatase MutT (NUDIX family)|nr:CoA pyrophosphatase [Ralstonia mannitolilytica]ATG21377.1 CoA pyrophosphatase [Ralstonia pickettii]ANA34277.1 DNA mismatch repair protein MutT [Ralstonia mannitolilytica]MBY4721032.1 CoA pyrophosphatase [Ralstonia mannitolilytica]CAJ0680789.1 putative Nudix hydrolase NudL [Ralstonia mannitolilytica]CAJ0775085.1 putative Nudix hydrolase NudL [Ralstonia mannitolilytica]